MRESNKAIERTPYPSPLLEDLINVLQGGKLDCKLDMNNAFLQFESDSASPEITTFTTHEGCTDLKDQTLEQRRNQNYYKEKWTKFLAIADDVMLFVTSFDTMYDTLDKVLNRFLECGTTLNKQKCKLFRNKVEFFGFVFSEKGITPQTKIESIPNMPPPTNISELRSFLGTANYLSRFIPNYSMRMYPLLELTKKNIP